jgi:hypothetical protein
MTLNDLRFQKYPHPALRATLSHWERVLEVKREAGERIVQQ